MNLNFAERMERLGTETAFEVMARAKALEAQGREIVHLQIGEPDFPTPKHIIEAGVEALRAGETHYSPAAGIMPLREAIVEDVDSRRGIRPKVEQVVVTPGAKPIMFFAILALIDSDDEIIYPNPGFPIYESVINFVGGKAVPLPLWEENDFRFSPEEFRSLVTDRTKLIIINSPHNPTGGILTRQDNEVIAEVAREKEILVLSDEVYKNIIYEGEHHSIYSLPGMQERTILLDGFSKTYAMTGWRLGFGVMPEELAQKIERLMINSNSCTATFSQHAAIQALQGPTEEVDAMLEEFRKRRDIIVAGLNDIPGMSCITPKGAFYAFPNVKKINEGSQELENYLLNEAGVAVLSGTAFGKYGDGYLRFSYANSVENIEKGLERIKNALKNI
ncbi:pyridoxal phosphate-dependent aminotransferase [candidate division KSB1 bacterium]|nr:pyridoxal phosphate-dependent aminotransferase [candidate division KSB1 bacterium]NIR69376.1 pyridoxal phosphate-dependent aminotransferase [candidate division KSB1 bacterium]NIS24194.1 pyridoxal phosphate-dependent aminotransferase [candidate division KSB1 bacterium]NIT71109.1 pyridoxal phosphate-dependent aminotransferase [candidate division KSB1 bacterium]NIU24813.1 pyridoxal phosphate-dependent aminotransferase [candidate division KSB1 bacterium]